MPLAVPSILITGLTGPELVPGTVEACVHSCLSGDAATKNRDLRNGHKLNGNEHTEYFNSGKLR